MPVLHRGHVCLPVYLHRKCIQWSHSLHPWRQLVHLSCRDTLARVPLFFTGYDDLRRAAPFIPRRKTRVVQLPPLSTSQRSRMAPLSIEIGSFLRALFNALFCSTVRTNFLGHFENRVNVGTRAVECDRIVHRTFQLCSSLQASKKCFTLYTSKE